MRSKPVTAHEKILVAKPMIQSHQIRMRHLIRPSLTGVLLTLSLALALAMTGFGHRLPVSQDTGLASYVLAGGDLADLCGTAKDGRTVSRGCDICHLAGSATLPPAEAGLRDADLRVVAVMVLPQMQRTTRSPRDPAHGLRAPPLA